LVGTACLAALIAAPAGAQAIAPQASTGGVANVTASGAVLKGTVNPRGRETAYYFQYGPAKRYDYATQAINVGSGTRTLGVSVAIASLAANTAYHYRIVAAGTGGGAIGADRSFTTAKIPLSLQIAAAPNPVSFGGTTIVEGTLTGTGNANREVVLEANPFPYTGGFKTLGNPELTTASGSFAFPVLGLGGATQFLVVSSGRPTITSPIFSEGVAIQVTAQLRRARGRRRVRVFGTVTPALNGALVAIEKINRHGRFVTVGGTVLRHGRGNLSQFSRVVTARRAGIYRVLVQSTTGALASNYSAPIVVR
jgi:hypothetical protein